MSTGSTAVERLRRLLVMVPWLLEHPGASLREIGRRFGVAPDVVADDLNVLGYCGLPGYGGGDLVEVTIVGDAVTIRMADAFRRPLNLSLGEGLALLLAARATLTSGLLGEAAPLRRAVQRLERHLGVEEAAPVMIDLASPGSEHLEAVTAAVEQGEVLRLAYRSASRDETRVRDVDPWRLVMARGAWYLQAWCHRAGAPRDFRLDRIAGLERTGLAASHPAPSQHPLPVYRPDPDDPRAVIELAPAAAWLLDELVVDAAESLEDGWQSLELRARSLEWLARLLVRVGDDVRVVEPSELRSAVIRCAQEVMARYDHRG